VQEKRGIAGRGIYVGHCRANSVVAQSMRAVLIAALVEGVICTAAAKRDVLRVDLRGNSVVPRTSEAMGDVVVPGTDGKNGICKSPIRNTRARAIAIDGGQRTKVRAGEDGSRCKVSRVKCLVPPRHRTGVGTLLPQDAFEGLDIVAVPVEEDCVLMDCGCHLLMYPDDLLVPVLDCAYWCDASGKRCKEALDGADVASSATSRHVAPLHTSRRRRTDGPSRIWVRITRYWSRRRAGVGVGQDEFLLREHGERRGDAQQLPFRNIWSGRMVQRQHCS